MGALLANGKPFVIDALDGAENPDHDDQKMLVVWSHKKELSRLCKGFISTEPDRATCLPERAQGAAMALTFGLRMRVAAGRLQAEALARRLLRGEGQPKGNDEGS
ncbi:MAG: hypothetical protein J0H17_12600 [Rhizobiales bacterium]|nr:hypothetical protein [Hyphomicrobiales bacterium]